MAPTPDLSKFKTDKKITDEEILKILEQPINKNSGSKPKSKKKKKAKKPAAATAAAGDDDDDDEEDDE